MKPKLSENADFIVSRLDDGKLLKLSLRLALAWPSGKNISAGRESIWLLVGVQTSPGCQAAGSGDECDVNASFDCMD
jgi:hypothetical protein